MPIFLFLLPAMAGHGAKSYCFQHQPPPSFPLIFAHSPELCFWALGQPIIGGWNLTDVLITGNNGTIAGQADIWWNTHLKVGKRHPRVLHVAVLVIAFGLYLMWT